MYGEKLFANGNKLPGSAFLATGKSGGGPSWKVLIVTKTKTNPIMLATIEGNSGPVYAVAKKGITNASPESAAIGKAYLKWRHLLGAFSSN